MAKKKAAEEQQEVKQQREIQIIEDPVMAVRTVPDMYIGSLGSAGFLNMFREITQNSLDEIERGTTLDKNIIISYDARSHLVINEDNGQGIPLDKLVKVFSVLHSSSNYHKTEGTGYTSGKNGVGATITNFLSKFFVVESYRMDGTAGKVEFEEGYLNKKGLQKIKCPAGKHGLITTFQPSDMRGEITIGDEEIEALLRQLCLINAIGTRITFNAITKTGMKRKVILENKGGIFELLGMICQKPLFEPVYFSMDDGSKFIECLFTYDISAMDDPQILSYANMCPTNGGTHVNGFLDALVKYFRNYMNKIVLAGNKKLAVNAQDIRTGLRAVVIVKSISPIYTGQSKEFYSEENMAGFVSSVALTALDEWSKKFPGDLQKASKYLKEVCEIRSKSDNEKIKMSDKFTSSAITGLPVKYKRPNGRGPFELIITEGDSATSGMENNRDKATQG